MLLLIIFSLLVFFSVIECTKAEVKYNNDLENIMKNYLKPLKILTANLPNHEVEIQIEYQNPSERKLPIRPPQGHVYAYNPLRFNANKNLFPSRRNNDEFPVNAARRANAVPAALGPTTTAKNAAATTRPAATLAPVSTVPPGPLAPPAPPALSPPPEAAAGKQPIYLEDLKEVLDDFVQKIQGKPMKDANKPIIVSNAGPVHGNQPNLEAIMNLLKQGLQVAKRIQVPNDEELEWLQIKLPKNV